MPALDHLHTYVRYRKKYYRCIDPKCTHFTAKDFLLGKAAKCQCGNEFILDRYALKLAQPKCLACSDTKKAKTFKAAKSIMDLIFDESTETDVKEN